ncbi:hypothetical protein [Mycolicibacterium sp. XJ879]
MLIASGIYTWILYTSTIDREALDLEFVKALLTFMTITVLGGAITFLLHDGEKLRDVREAQRSARARMREDIFKKLMEAYHELHFFWSELNAAGLNTETNSHPFLSIKQLAVLQTEMGRLRRYVYLMDDIRREVHIEAGESADTFDRKNSQIIVGVMKYFTEELLGPIVKEWQENGNYFFYRDRPEMPTSSLDTLLPKLQEYLRMTAESAKGEEMLEKIGQLEEIIYREIVDGR